MKEGGEARKGKDENRDKFIHIFLPSRHFHRQQSARKQKKSSLTIFPARGQVCRNAHNTRADY
jgi:hypothetical protein